MVNDPEQSLMARLQRLIQAELPHLLDDSGALVSIESVDSLSFQCLSLELEDSFEFPISARVADAIKADFSLVGISRVLCSRSSLHEDEEVLARYPELSGTDFVEGAGTQLLREFLESPFFEAYRPQDCTPGAVLRAYWANFREEPIRDLFCVPIREQDGSNSLEIAIYQQNIVCLMRVGGPQSVRVFSDVSFRQVEIDDESLKVAMAFEVTAGGEKSYIVAPYMFANLVIARLKDVRDTLAGPPLPLRFSDRSRLISREESLLRNLRTVRPLCYITKEHRIPGHLLSLQQVARFLELVSSENDLMQLFLVPLLLGMGFTIAHQMNHGTDDLGQEHGKDLVTVSTVGDDSVSTAYVVKRGNIKQSVLARVIEQVRLALTTAVELGEQKRLPNFVKVITSGQAPEYERRQIKAQATATQGVDVWDRSQLISHFYVSDMDLQSQRHLLRKVVEMEDQS